MQPIELIEKEFKKTYTLEFSLMATLTLIDDIVNENRDRETRVTPTFSLGNIHDLPGFYKVEWVVTELVNTVVGVALSRTLSTLDIQPQDVGADLGDLIRGAVDQHESIVAAVIECAKLRFGDVQVDEDEADRMLDYHNDRMADLISHLQGDHSCNDPDCADNDSSDVKPTIH